MANPALWYIMGALFCVAGVMNLFKGIRRGGDQGRVNVWIGIAGFVWSAAALTYRFVGMAPAYVIGGCAMAIMVWASVLSAKVQHQQQ